MKKKESKLKNSISLHSQSHDCLFKSTIFCFENDKITKMLVDIYLIVDSNQHVDCRHVYQVYVS